VTTRIAVRGYAGKKVLFEDRVDGPDEDLENFVSQMAVSHAHSMAAHTRHMIEIEFLDEPNQNERFFRFGTDPAGMVMPVAIPLHDDPKANAAEVLSLLTTRSGRPN